MFISLQTQTNFKLKFCYYNTNTDGQKFDHNTNINTDSIMGPEINQHEDTLSDSKVKDEETVFRLNFPTSIISQEVVKFLRLIDGQELSIDNDEVTVLISKVDEVLENYRRDKHHCTMVQELNGYEPNHLNEAEIKGLKNLRDIFQTFNDQKNEVELSTKPETILNNDKNHKNIIQTLMEWLSNF